MLSRFAEKNTARKLSANRASDDRLASNSALRQSGVAGTTGLQPAFRTSATGDHQRHAGQAITTRKWIGESSRVAPTST
jgi:hypothetical protein